MGRRLLAVCVLALCLVRDGDRRSRCAARPTRSSPQEWWLAHIGADPAAAPPGPGVPITIVDSGTDPTHPEFAGRPNTTFLNDQTTSGRDEYHGTIVASVAAAPENGVGLAGVYPSAALAALRRERRLARHQRPRGDHRHRDGGRALPRRDQPQLRQHRRRIR